MKVDLPAVKSHYELLDVARDASADEIKRAFRREIAKYHPDKVQHLGKEFQDIAANKAAELTHAYKTLIDAESRAEYDAQLEGASAAVEVAAAAAPAAAATTATERRPEAAAHRRATPRPTGGAFVEERASAMEVVRRATIMRFRTALDGEFGSYEQVSLQGFEVTCIPKPSFWSLKLQPRVLGRFVPVVNGPALAEAWSMASRMKKDGQRDLCVFLMGPALAAPAELAGAIAEQRKRPYTAGGKMILVPVNTQDWNGLVPTDAPPMVKSLLARLKSA